MSILGNDAVRLDGDVEFVHNKTYILWIRFLLSDEVYKWFLKIHLATLGFLRKVTIGPVPGLHMATNFHCLFLLEIAASSKFLSLGPVSKRSYQEGLLAYIGP